MRGKAVAQRVQCCPLFDAAFLQCAFQHQSCAAVCVALAILTFKEIKFWLRLPVVIILAQQGFQLI